MDEVTTASFGNVNNFEHRRLAATAASSVTDARMLLLIKPPGICANESGRCVFYCSFQLERRL